MKNSKLLIAVLFVFLWVESRSESKAPAESGEECLFDLSKVPKVATENRPERAETSKCLAELIEKGRLHVNESGKFESYYFSSLELKHTGVASLFVLHLRYLPTIDGIHAPVEIYMDLDGKCYDAVEFEELLLRIRGRPEEEPPEEEPTGRGTRLIEKKTLTDISKRLAQGTPSPIENHAEEELG